MFSIQMMPASTPKWDDLSLRSTLDASQLQKMTAEIELIVMAIVALTQIDRVEIERVARSLQLDSILEWVNEWPTVRSTPSEPLDLDRLKALVLIAHHLAQEHQTLVRRNINYWQQTVQYDRLPLQSPSLADYIGNFITIYQTRLGTAANQSFEALTAAALALLLELLFYGSPLGHQRLWGALLQRSDSKSPPASTT